MKNVHTLSSTRRRLSMALAGLLITVVVAGCCTDIPVRSGGKLVPSGAIDENGNPVPAGAECTSGETCGNPGTGCGLFRYQNECTNTWNSVTGECKCECR